MAAVFPQLNRRTSSAEWKDGLIYFGHLRRWDASLLAKKMQDTAMLPVLSKQLVAMSAIAWRKHVFLQWSFGGAAIGILVLVLIGLVTNIECSSCAP